MKIAAIFLLIMTVVSYTVFGANCAQAAEGGILIAYFSWSGNTREIANQIHERTGGSLFEIKTVNPYPATYRECTEYAKKEQENNARPELSAEVPNMDSYNIIFIGYPNWWSTIPMPIFTFLEKYDFSGKTIVPFCTHGGGRFGRSIQDISKLCPQAKMLEGFEIKGVDARGAQNEISSWLRGIGMIE